jgi:hypothetical protein
VNLPFLSDDYVFLMSYRRWSDALSTAQFFRPVFALVFVFLATVGNGSVLPFHVASLLIHAALATLVYVLAVRFFKRADAAAFCFVIFLLNPLQLEAVLWVSGLQELLWAFFVVAALVVHTTRQGLSPLRIVCVLALIGLALLCKETAVASVLLIPATDWVLFRMRRGPGLTAAYVGLAAVAAAYLLLRTLVTAPEAGFLQIPGKYFAQKFLATPYEFFVQPWNRAAADVPPVVLGAAAAAIVVLLFRGIVLGAGPTVLAGPAVILFSTLPVFTYFHVAADLRGSRYLYLPAFGWALLAVHLCIRNFIGQITLGAVFLASISGSFLSLRLNATPWHTAGQIVKRVSADVAAGKAGIRGPEDWRNEFGEGFEFQDGIPAVYRGVYLFVNGYPEFQTIVANPPR